MSDALEWPTSEGIWMGNIPSVGWFPMRVIALKDDLPPIPKPAGYVPATLAYVAEFPESVTSWPYTFHGCHPATEWRLPTEEELFKAQLFYGFS